jgi:predicted amidohydrolase YtcJ
MEWCQNGPGTREFDTTKTVIANYQRVQVGHAYADKGVDYFLDSVEAAMKENPAITAEFVKGLRLSSDHCGFYPRISQIPRMAQFGMYISCGAGVLTRSFPWIGEGKYAPRYLEQIAPIRSAIAGGVVVTTESSGGIGADNRGMSPFAANIPFLTRKNRYGQMVSEGEKVDRNTLLKMMTNWAAQFTMKEDVIGSLEPGKWADIAVFQGDYFAGQPEDIAHVYPVMTILGGKIQVLQGDFARELGKQPVGRQVTFVADMQEPPPMPE